MATPTRLANKTIDSLELAADVLTGIVTDFGSVSDFFAQDLAASLLTHDKAASRRIVISSIADSDAMLDILSLFVICLL